MSCNYLPRTTCRKARNQGLILPLLALLSTVIICFVGIAINMSYYLLVVNEMQLAADAASHAAASVLCSSKSCYQKAVDMALRVLSEHELHGILTAPARYSISRATHGPGPEWRLDQDGDGDTDLIVNVHRGHWWPKVDERPARVPPYCRTEEPRFESYEETWSSDFPGVPDFMAANAVFVRLERPDRVMLFNPFKPQNTAPAAVAVAVMGEISQDIEVGPFAVPVCALIDGSGDFDSDRACTFDRVFTEVARYCSNNRDRSGCGIFPSFFWYPTKSPRSFSTVDTDADPTNRHANDRWRNDCTDVSTGSRTESIPNSCSAQPELQGGCCTSINDEAWWPHPRLAVSDSTAPAYGVPVDGLFHPTDMFGVVGLPEGYPIMGNVLRPRIESGPLWQTTIGEDFQVILRGYPYSGDAPDSRNFGRKWDDSIWKQITNAANGGVADRYHVPFSQTDFPFIERMYSRPRTIPATGTPSAYTHDQSFMDPLTGLTYRLEETGGFHSGLFSETWHGLCNSHRLGMPPMFDDAQEPAWGSGSWSDDSYPDGAGVTGGIGAYCYQSRDSNAFLPENGLVWQIPLPVIADPNSDAQRCGQGQGNDPSVLPSIGAPNSLRIIGFIKVNIFDVDIGYLPPRFPEQCFAQGISWGINHSDPYPPQKWCHHYPWGFTTFKVWLYDESVDEEPFRVPADPPMDLRMKPWVVPDDNCRACDTDASGQVSCWDVVQPQHRPCDLTRGRTVCGSGYIATTNLDAPPTPQIVR